MRENYYFYRANKYVIDKDNNIWKVINKEKFKVSSFELKGVKEFISKTNGDMYKSPIINKIAKRNYELNRIDFLPEILDGIENYIPEDLRDSFYNNLKTIHFNIDSCREWDGVSYVDSGYNIILNSIHVGGEYLGLLKHISEMWEEALGENQYLNSVKYAFTHELLHMASRRNEDDITYSGITAFPDDDLSQTNTPLNEAITEIISYCITPCEVSYNTSSYKNYIILGYQLGRLVGRKIIDQSYFANKGTDLIIEKLDEIDFVYDKANYMLDTLASCYYISNPNEKAYNLLIVQDLLLDYYTAKLKKCLEDKDFDSIGSLISLLQKAILEDFGRIKLNQKCSNMLESNRNKLNRILDIYDEFIPKDDDSNKKIKE